ncbi:MAG: hypothetical protein D8M58_04960 [Calditrichaeota bacterium]|nr:MAG: hypothetical protein DWQ03_02115 [Calditrichota bacterium]MBL1204723.1 hypothetical protein [Calditrichota bacterium]NOG44551.1 NTP transferase domain-containing protein [Calditrichota bacterium]
METLPKINGLVISAGLSSRMGVLKPLMDYKGKPFLAGILLNMSLICDTILVVTGHESKKVKDETQGFLGCQVLNINSKVDWCYNRDYEQGMFNSLQAGLRELKNEGWILYHFVDQPGLPVDFYLDFKKEIDESVDWLQPNYNSRNGHPVLFSNKVKQRVLEHNSDQSLRKLKDSEDILKKYWSCNYPQILQDFNTPKDIIK